MVGLLGELNDAMNQLETHVNPLIGKVCVYLSFLNPVDFFAWWTKDGCSGNTVKRGIFLNMNSCFSSKLRCYSVYFGLKYA